MNDKPKLVFKFSKVKSRSGIRALLAHNLRIDKPKNADPEREKLNLYPKRTGQHINNTMMAIQRNLNGHKPRKNAVHAHEYVISGSHEHMKAMTMAESKKFFNDAIRFFREMYGKESMLIPTVHFDEKTPHLHLIIQPLKDGKLNGKHFTGGSKAVMEKLRTKFHKEVAQNYGLARGEPRPKVGHKELSEYYAMVEETLPKLKNEAAELKLNMAIDQSELDRTKDQVKELERRYELLRDNLRDIEDIRKRAASMTRNELVTAIQQLDERDYRPSLRR